MESPESFRKEGKSGVKLYASRELAESLKRAEENSSGDVQPAHLLYAIASQGGKGFDLIRVLSERRFGQVLKTLEELSSTESSFENQTQDSTIRRFSPVLQDLIGRAAEFSSRDVVSTDQVILADLTRPDSVLKKGFLKAGIKTPIKEVLDAIVDRIVYEEEGKVEIGSFPLPIQSAAESSSLVIPEQLGSESRGYFANLIQQAKEGRFDDVVIRPKWATEVLDSLERQPVTVMVTDQEVEALEIVSGTAAQLARDAKQVFPYKSLVVIDPSYIEERPEQAIKEAVTFAQDGILFIPDIARFKDLRLLNSAIASGNVKIITQISNSQWKKVGQERLFRDARPIFLDPPSVAETITILTSKKRQIEKRFERKGLDINISDEAIKETAKLADRYFRNLLPPSGAKALLVRAATNLRIRLSEMVDLYDPQVIVDNRIDEEDIRLALKHLTGIEVLAKDSERYLKMEDFLRKKVVGQDEAVEVVSDAVRRAQAGLKDPKRPIGSFIFMGPSGVGKTELSKALAEFLFDSEEAMVRLDMSEFQEKHQVARMIGAPPGYVGYEEGGQLTEAVRRNPYTIVLLDEIEKAHPEVINVLLQVLDEGRLTDGQGRTVDFRNTVIIMTGNVGSEFFQVEPNVGMQKVINAVEEEIKEAFRPEFLNRVDKTVIFGALKPEHISKIVDIQIQKVNNQLAEKGISLKLSDEVIKFLCEKGYNPAYGARPLRRAIQTYIETPISKRILTKDFASGDQLVADLSGENVEFRKQTS